MGDYLPSVDVFLPCCGEDLEVILDTVRAACALDYPPESYRIVVLDDGCSRTVRRAVERLSLELNCRNLHYTSRGFKVLSHSKAGNLNFGLNFVSGLPSGPSELVAVLDIDMIPLPHWLRTMLPYILADSKVGLANPAQRFYNIPDRDPFLQNLDIVFDGIETIKECVSSSWCKLSDQSHFFLSSVGFSSVTLCANKDQLNNTTLIVKSFRYWNRFRSTATSIASNSMVPYGQPLRRYYDFGVSDCSRMENCLRARDRAVGLSARHCEEAQCPAHTMDGRLHI